MSSIHVRLPDGRVLDLPRGSTVLDVAQRIGAGLARAALAGRVIDLDGHAAPRIVDLRVPLESDVAIEIVTSKDSEGAHVIRHSAEHVMADAVKHLFPQAQIDVGRTDHSEKFQYDFLVDRAFTAEDLVRIDAEMNRLIAEDAPFVRCEVSRAEAHARFTAAGETLKVSRLGDIPEGEAITLFTHGKFEDLCRGPHVQRAGQIGAFVLLESAGAYWRGDEQNPMLQRIYGTAFATRKDLEAHLARLEEARRRDHRRLGPELGLFHLDAISPGSPFYHPKGMTLYNSLVDYMRGLYPKYGYQEVMTPQLFRSDLFKTSGHYQNFADDMFRMAGDEGEELFVKPMNCPGHCHLYATQKWSYRDLPLRYAEFSRLHRNERSGTLTGLSRVRSMAQDDGHIYCEPDQVGDEVNRFFEMMNEVYLDLGISGVQVSVSTRPDQFIGDAAEWDRAEKTLIEAVQAAGYECGIKPKEGAFYAPKVECDFFDVLGRRWTLATIQIDMAMPGNFGLRYIGRDGNEHQPAMLHRAVLGSLERFISIYLEHTAGDFPLWLAPLQAVVLPITDRHTEYASGVRARLADAGIRAELDARSEKLGFKIREAETQKIPLMIVVGDQEQANGTVAPRRRHAPQGTSSSIPVEDFVASLRQEIAARRS